MTAAKFIYRLCRLASDPHYYVGWATIVTEPEDPKIYIELAGVEFTAQELEMPFTEALNRVIDHELVHLVGWTKDEEIALRFEEAGTWARMLQ